MKEFRTPKWVDRTLVGAIILFGLLLGLFGQPMILTGQGNSMEGRRGLRDGARELVLPLWLFFDVHEDGIYAFRAKGELWIKRATRIQGDYVWFLGDNQEYNKDGVPESIDSREFGWVHRNQVVGIRICSLPRAFDGESSAAEANRASDIQASPESIAYVNEARAMFARTHDLLDANKLYANGTLKIRSSNNEFNSPKLVDGRLNTCVNMILNKKLEIQIELTEPRCLIVVIPSGGSIPLEQKKLPHGLLLSAPGGSEPPFFMAGIAEIQVWQKLH